MLEIKNVSKTYRSGVQALKGIDLNIPSGMYGLLGPNGAGKSTLMNVLATLDTVDQGSITFNQFNVLSEPMKIRRRLGFLPQKFGFYPKVSAQSLLNHLAVLKGIGKKSDRSELVARLLKMTNLFEVRNQYLTEYSGGMKQRFGIAQAMLNDPDILILDEPTAGLDPAERTRFYNILSKLSDNKLVLLSTHLVHDVEQLCTRLAIMNLGRILVDGSPQTLVQDLRNRVYQMRASHAELDKVIERHQVLTQKYFMGKPIVRILSANHPGDGFVKDDPTLEDVYFAYIKNYINQPASKSDTHAI